MWGDAQSRAWPIEEAQKLLVTVVLGDIQASLSPVADITCPTLGFECYNQMALTLFFMRLTQMPDWLTDFPEFPLLLPLGFPPIVMAQIQWAPPPPEDILWFSPLWTFLALYVSLRMAVWGHSFIPEHLFVPGSLPHGSCMLIRGVGEIHKCPHKK